MGVIQFLNNFISTDPNRKSATNLRSSLIHAYFKDLETQEVLQFGYIPEELSDTKTANWNAIDIPGRSEPILGYVNSSSREFSLHLRFLAGVDQLKNPSTSSGEPNRNTTEDNTSAVKQKVDWCRSLVYPDYTNPNLIKPPHRVLFSIGRLIKSICVVSSVNAIYKIPWDINLLPLLAEVDLTLQEVNNIPKGYSEIREGILSTTES